AERVARLHHVPGRLDSPGVPKVDRSLDLKRRPRPGRPATFSLEGADDSNGDAQGGATPRPNVVPPSGETGDVNIG
ncbi:MAG: hypothetical protein M3019_04630, partial [Candidatus Dormibacteraeota bacterium]|nr:hypothetical protein [Candidatus Dormibacteraeota bacterium]